MFWTTVWSAPAQQFLIGNFVSSLACPHMPLLTFLGLIGLIVGQFVGFLGFFVVLFVGLFVGSLVRLMVFCWWSRYVDCHLYRRSWSEIDHIFDSTTSFSEVYHIFDSTHRLCISLKVSIFDSDLKILNEPALFHNNLIRFEWPRPSPTSPDRFNIYERHFGHLPWNLLPVPTGLAIYSVFWTAIRSANSLRLSNIFRILNSDSER